MRPDVLAAPVTFPVRAHRAEVWAVVRMIFIPAIAALPEFDWVGVGVEGPIRFRATRA